MFQSSSKDFYYRDFIEFDITLYFRNCILGARRYLLNEKDENIPRALNNLRRLKIVDKVCKAVIATVFLYLIFIKLDLLGLVLHLASYRTTYSLELECN